MHEANFLWPGATSVMVLAGTIVSRAVVVTQPEGRQHPASHRHGYHLVACRIYPEDQRKKWGGFYAGW